jgi:hypothetical protein
MPDDKFFQLRGWLEKFKEHDKTKTHATIFKDLEIIKDPVMGRCVITKEEIEKGTNVMKIPKIFLLNYITVLKYLSFWNEDINKFLKEKIKNFCNDVYQTTSDEITLIYSRLDINQILKLTSHQLLTLFICLEQKRNGNSFWKPFLSCFPELHEYEGIPMTWTFQTSTSTSTSTSTATDKELFSLLPKNLNNHSIDQANRFVSDIENIKSILKTFQITIDENEYLWAWLAINTRCLYYNLPSYLPITLGNYREESNITMVPFVDYINHQTTNFNSIARETKSGYEVITTSALSKNEQFWFTYGPHSDDFLQCEYGFSVSQIQFENDKFEFRNLNLYNTVNLSSPILALLNNPKKKKVVGWLKQVGYYDDYTIGIDEILKEDEIIKVSASYRTRVALAALIEKDQEFSFNENEGVFKGPLKLEKFYQGYNDGEYYQNFENLLLIKILTKLEIDIKTKLTKLSQLIEKNDSKIDRKSDAVLQTLLNQYLIIKSFLTK